MTALERKAAILKGFVQNARDLTSEGIVLPVELFNKAVEVQNLEVYTADSLNDFIRNIQKSFDSDQIGQEEVEKARKDLGKLRKVTKVDKNGKKTTVYVKQGEDPKSQRKPAAKEELSGYKSHTKNNPDEIRATIKRQEALLKNPKSPESAKKRANEILKIEHAKLKEGQNEHDPKSKVVENKENKPTKPNKVDREYDSMVEREVEKPKKKLSGESKASERSADHQALLDKKHELHEKVQEAIKHEKDPDKRAELHAHDTRLSKEKKQLSGEEDEQQVKVKELVDQAAADLHNLQENYADQGGEQKFYDALSKYYEPEDDGESEHTMFENLSKLSHEDLDSFTEDLREALGQAEMERRGVKTKDRSDIDSGNDEDSEEDGEDEDMKRGYHEVDGLKLDIDVESSGDTFGVKDFLDKYKVETPDDNTISFQIGKDKYELKVPVDLQMHFTDPNSNPILYEKRGGGMLKVAKDAIDADDYSYMELHKNGKLIHKNDNEHGRDEIVGNDEEDDDAGMSEEERLAKRESEGDMPEDEDEARRKELADEDEAYAEASARGDEDSEDEDLGDPKEHAKNAETLTDSAHAQPGGGRGAHKHKLAQEAHEKAAKAHRKAGNESDAQYHDKMAGKHAFRVRHDENMGVRHNKDTQNHLTDSEYGELSTSEASLYDFTSAFDQKYGDTGKLAHIEDIKAIMKKQDITDPDGDGGAMLADNDKGVAKLVKLLESKGWNIEKPTKQSKKIQKALNVLLNK